MTIPFVDLRQQYLSNKQAIDAAIHAVLEHGQYIMGPEIGMLEKQLEQYINVKHAITCSSGTDALVIALMTKNLTRKDAVFTSPFTFFATPESITLAGGTPVFVDIDPDTYNMDPQHLQKQIDNTYKNGHLTPRGIVPVDLFGIAADYEKINTLAQQHQLFVIEDAAQSFAAPYKNKKAGCLGEIGTTSFYPAKPLGCYGDGGAIFTNDTDLYQQMISIRIHGQDEIGHKYNNLRIGLNGRMDTLQAAILLEKLKLYDNEIRLRNEIANWYTHYLNGIVKTPAVPAEQGSIWAQYAIETDYRDSVKKDLLEKDIPTAIFYPQPAHLTPAYQHLGYKAGDFPISEKVAQNILCLPIHPFLDKKMVSTICNVITQSVIYRKN